MTKKHFIELADMIKANPSAFSPAAIGALANFCAEQNPRFNRELWFDYVEGKCGPSGGKIKD